MEDGNRRLDALPATAGRTLHRKPPEVTLQIASTTFLSGPIAGASCTTTARSPDRPRRIGLWSTTPVIRIKANVRYLVLGAVVSGQPRRGMRAHG